jgi:predicted RNase H-like HicB family nuclease
MVVVRAKYDGDAKVWVAKSSDFPDLHAEAATLDELGQKLPGIIQDLMKSDNSGEMEISVEAVAS